MSPTVTTRVLGKVKEKLEGRGGFGGLILLMVEEVITSQVMKFSCDSGELVRGAACIYRRYQSCGILILLYTYNRIYVKTQGKD